MTEKDNSWWYICIISVFVFFVFVFGFITGSLASHNAIWKSLETTGICRLITHETVVDGVMTTNWVEIVWKDEAK